MVLGCITLPGQQPLGLHDTSFSVKLLSPISTHSSKKGDQFTALVEAPQLYAGSIMEGTIKELSRPKPGLHGGRAQVTFEFTSLTPRGMAAPIPISADVQGISNSKGVQNVDEEGRVLGRTSNKKRALGALVGAAAGAGLGAAAGGGSGAAIGAAAGAGLGLLIAVKYTSSGSDLDLQPGAHLRLAVSDRSGHRRS